MSNYDSCCECEAYGDDYFTNENGEEECRCRYCADNPDIEDEYECID